MTRVFSLVIFSVSLTTSLLAENRAEIVKRVGGDIKYLASDELEGRGPGTKGLEKAADFIRDEFKRFGLKSGTEDGTFMQPFEIAISMKVVEPKTKLVLRGPDGQELKLSLADDFQPLAIGGGGTVKAPVVFAGYGIKAAKEKYDDYAEADVKGKVLLIIRREPQQDDEDSVFDGKKTTRHSYIHTKLEAAKQFKAAAVLLINDPFTTKSKKQDELTKPSGFGTRNLKIPFAHITQKTADAVFSQSPVRAGDASLRTVDEIEQQIDKTLKPLTQPLEGWTAEIEVAFDQVKADVANVVGVLEGEGPLANETVVIGAHYDHLGYGPFGSRKPEVRAIHNGADDNATGTAAVVELARRFGSRGKKPARRMVFVGFSAEERGIIGSNHYISKPLIPLEDTVTMMNFDMIGQLGEAGLTVGGVRSAQEFGSIFEKLNDNGNLKVKAAGTMGGSDHIGFFRKEIPVIFFHTGLTKLYHTPEDDYETINVEGVVSTIDFAERMLDQVVSLPKRPAFVKQAAKSRGGPNKGAMAYLGVVPDYTGTVEGVRITDVNKKSPAATGGLKADDVIRKIGDVDVADIQGLAAGLRKYKAGQEVEVVVQRGERQETLKVTLGQPQKTP